MFCCFVCQFTCEVSNDLQNHMQRHRKADLIRAVIKLPTEIVHINGGNGGDLSTSSTMTCHSLAASEETSVTEDKSDHEEINNNNNTTSSCRTSNLRRSCRLKDIMNRFDPDKDHMPFESIDDNYYIPDDDCTMSKHSSAFTDFDDSDDEVLAKAPLRKGKSRTKKPQKESRSRKKIRQEPILSTPKIEKDPTSDTDSCSGNAHLTSSTNERMFCNYCGSGYRTEAMLADHIRHNHLNFCTLCEVNFPDMRRYREHAQKHLIKMYVCPYCDMEFTARDISALHVQRHLQTSVLDDVLSLEADYFTERTYMNTMYNMFNAGFLYGRQSPGGGLFGGHATKMPAEFYKVFLQCATFDVAGIDNFGYLCRTCGFTFFDLSYYRDHMQIAHGVATADVERFLNI